MFPFSINKHKTNKNRGGEERRGETSKTSRGSDGLSGEEGAGTVWSLDQGPWGHLVGSAESCNVAQIVNHKSVPERHTLSGGTETGQANTVRLSGVQSLAPGLVRFQNRVVVKRSSREPVSPD